MTERTRGYLPHVYRDLRAENPEIAEAYDALGDRLGVVPAAIMLDVDEALRLHLGL